MQVDVHLFVPEEAECVFLLLGVDEPVGRACGGHDAGGELF